MAESLIAQPSKANTLAKAGLSPEIQGAGASLAAAVTLGGGPVLKLLQKGGVAKLGKLAPDLVGALRSMTPAQAERLTGAPEPTPFAQPSAEAPRKRLAWLAEEDRMISHVMEVLVTRLRR